MKRLKSKKTKDRIIVYVYILFLYISLPFAPKFWEGFVQRTGKFANYISAIILGIAGLCILVYLIIQKKGIYCFLWLSILGFCYAFGLSSLKLAIERIHFVEYTLLSLLIFRALRHNIQDKFLYLYSGTVVFCLGFLDEGIQYILPNRVYDIRDVLVNGMAGVLGLLVIALCFRPQLASPE